MALRAAFSSTLIASALVALPAWADGTVLVLQLEARGLPEATQTALDAAVREELGASLGKRTKLLPRPALDYAGLREATGCADASNSCLQAIGRTISATQVVLVSLLGEADNAKLEVVLVDVASGKTKTGGGELADVAPESAPEVRYFVALALGQKREPPQGSVTPYVASAVGKLEGAELFVDGVAAKPADLSKLAAGRHTLEVRQQGFEPFRWTGPVRGGRETRVGVTLTPAVPEPVAVAPSPPPTPDIAPTPAPSPEAAPSADVAPPAAVARVEAESGPNYLVPGILGVATLSAAVVATIEGARVLSFQSKHAEVCNVTSGRDPACGEAVDPGPTCTLELCEDARSAASVSTAFWVATGVLAAGAITSYLIVDHLDEGGPTGVIAPVPGGATLLIHY